MPTPLALPSELTIYSLGALKAACLDAMPKPSKAKRSTSREAAAWPVDASAVNEIDASGLQLLLALSTSLQARRRSLQLVNPSQPLVNACRLLGLASLVGSPGDTE